MEPAADSPRRLRLRVAFKLAIGVGAIAAASILLAYMGGGAGEAPARTTRVAVDDLLPGQARRLEWNGRPVIVLRRASAGADEDGWFVAIASGTVMGCPVAWEPTQETFLESCSGTRYDAEGRPLDTAGVEPLKRPPHHFDDAGRLVLGRD